MKLLSARPHKRNYPLWPIAWIGVTLVAIEAIAHVGVEILWFEEVGYLPMFLGRSLFQASLAIGTLAITAAYLLGNLELAHRLKFSHPQRHEPGDASLSKLDFTPAPRREAGLHLYLLLPLTLGASLLVGAIGIHYLQAAASQWGIDPYSPDINPPAPHLFHPDSLWQIADRVRRSGWMALGLGMVTIAIQIYPRWLLDAIGLISSLAIAGTISQQWMRVLPLFRATAFGQTDPMFGLDIGAYIFGLPVAELLEFTAMGTCLLGFISVLLTYLLSGDSLSRGRFGGFSRSQQRHLYALGGILMLAVSLSYALSCIDLVYSPRGVSFGASFTDITVILPANAALSILALAIGGYLIWQAIYFPQSARFRGIRTALILYLILEIGTNAILPAIVQTLIVQPNELARESPYIQRTIALTRQAFGLNEIEVNTFNPQANLDAAKIQANDRIVRNIRLWDKQPLLATNRQLQQIRLYYTFPDADIDRYTLASSQPVGAPDNAAVPAPTPTPSTEQQQVLIAARELDYNAVPDRAQTWVNEHLVYTHGYGFTLSPVNRATAGGLPEYLVKDIGIGEDRPLTTSTAAQASIPIGQPRIYYGESTDTYVMTGTQVKELDYPSGTENVYNTYDGRSGINIGATWRKLAFATYFQDWNMAITPEFLPQTKLLMRRNIDRRIRAIAPFLRFDRDPYLVAADARANPTSTVDQSYLYWIVDAYTTSDRYPYADSGREGINYIRNSVKVVIDAYHGTTRFYVADPSDPIVTTWAKIFPDLFQPLSAMPATLRSHLRYPVDYFKMQSERLMTYHMTDPQVFYNREDRWQIPNEVYGDKPRLVEPYYAITSLPTVPVPEFNLILPYTPQQRTNLVAWLAARSDGDNYGKLVLYTFPKQRLIYGPEQIEARINQDPQISSQISLWNREGSRAIQGNLLIVPIDRSLLYVEPLYIEATQNKLPTLVRVIVAYEDRIVMAESLAKALGELFKS